MARIADELLTAFESRFEVDSAITPNTIAEAPSWKGAYVLAIRLDDPVEFAGRNLSHVFAPGWYAYCGSAHGPGGVGARLRRHFSRVKKRHWHVDWLTIGAAQVTAVASRDGTECDFASGLAAMGSFRPVLDGFGSSDCATCRSHLLAWRP